MKQIELLAATTPSRPAPDLAPAGDVDEAGEPGWVMEASGTLI